jgi:hypothetical protein
MKTKQSSSPLSLLLGAALVSLLLGFSASGQFVVTTGQNLTYAADLYLDELDATKTVIIEAGGSMTVNARVNMSGQIFAPAAPPPCRLILNGGSFTQAVDTAGIKFPDNWGPVEIWINAGTLSAYGIQHLGYNSTRGPALILVGDGELILETGYGTASNDYDPLQWVNFTNTVASGVPYANGLKALPGYVLSFEDLGAGAVKISGVASTNCAPITLPASSTAVLGQPASISVILSPGLNATQATTVGLVSANPNVAVPQGAVNGALTLTFPAGGHYATNIPYNAVAPGSTVFYLTNATAAFCVTTTESQITVGSSLYVSQDSYVEGFLDSRDTNFGDNTQVRVSQVDAQGGRKGYFLFDATGLPEILSVDGFQTQRAGGTTSRTILLFAILGTNLNLGTSVNDWTEMGITWNNAPANNVGVNTNRAFVAYPGESLIQIDSFSTGSLGDAVYNVSFEKLNEDNRQAILSALNTGDRKLTLGLQYNSSQATTIGFRSKEYDDGSFGARLNVTFAPLAILGVVINETGDQVELTGSAGSYTTETFHVLSASDLALPLSSWTSIATNQFQAGSFSVSVPRDPGAPQAFYILEVQP